MTDRPLTNLEKLAIAGYAAARIRGSKVRKITTVDADGKPVRVIDSDEMQGKLLERQGIELDAKGMTECVACKRRFAKAGSNGALARLCRGCRITADSWIFERVRCCICTKQTTTNRKAAIRRLTISERIICKSCNAREMSSRLSPEQRRMHGRKSMVDFNSKLTTSQKRARLEKALAVAHSKECQTARVRARWACIAPEDRAKQARDRYATLPEKSKSAFVAAGRAAQTTEQLRAAGRKGARRANAAKKTTDTRETP